MVLEVYHKCEVYATTRYWRGGIYLYNKYEELLNEGIEHESSAAAYFMLLDMVYGNNNAIADPKRAYEMAENFTKTGDFHYGRFYIIMGKADEQLGRYANASNNFELATQYGFAEGYYWQAL